MWRQLGPLICRWCGIKETETNMGFEIDHILPLEDGGQDVFENTQPLCSACHWLRNAERHRVKYLKLKELERQQMYEDYLESLKADDELPF
jgi:5-methylcytosine-specific restriction endonuclease McrA